MNLYRLIHIQFISYHYNLILKSTKGQKMRKILTSLLITTLTTFALTLNEIPKEVILDGKNGGLLNEKSWNSTTVKDKLHLLLYVNPNKKEDNEAFINALHQKNYDLKKYGLIAIINLKAIWLPNFAIEKMLEKKQQEFPSTIYVKDKTKYLEKEWNLENNSNLLIFDKEGKLIYQKSGTIMLEDMSTIFKLIEKNLD